MFVGFVRRIGMERRGGEEMENEKEMKRNGIWQVLEFSYISQKPACGQLFQNQRLTHFSFLSV